MSRRDAPEEPSILSENIDNSAIYSNKVDLLPINKGVSLWIQKLNFWKNQKIDRSFKGNDNYNINVQNRKLFDWYSSWLKRYSK